MTKWVPLFKATNVACRVHPLTKWPPSREQTMVCRIFFSGAFLTCSLAQVPTAGYFTYQLPRYSMTPRGASQISSSPMYALCTNPAENMERRNPVLALTFEWPSRDILEATGKNFSLCCLGVSKELVSRLELGCFPLPRHLSSWTHLGEMLPGWQQDVMDGQRMATEWQGCWSVTQACVYKKEEAVSWS